MKRSRPSPSSASSSQLQIWTPEKKTCDRSRTIDLAIVPSSDDSNTPFTLPAGWIVERRRRSSGMMRGCIDKYYIDPVTGRKLRSLVAVKRYLSDPGHYEIDRRGDCKPRFENEQLYLTMPGYDSRFKSSSSTRQSLKLRSLFSSSFKQHNQIAVYRKSFISKNQVYIDRSKPLKLPQGWYIKRITRRSGHSEGRVDKYYCERATGRVFRSRLDVQRYLADNDLEENTTLSQLFKPAGLIQVSCPKRTDVDSKTPKAIVSHFDERDSYSDISDDVPLKDLVQKDDDVPLKDLVLKSDGVPLKDLVHRSDDVPLKDLLRKSDDVPLKDLVRNSDDVPIKDLVCKSTAAGKTSKSSNTLGSPNKNVHSSKTTNPLPAYNVSNPPMKIKWVLTGPVGDAWSPFMGDAIVPESLKEEWAQMFTDVVNQKHTNPSSPDALD